LTTRAKSKTKKKAAPEDLREFDWSARIENVLRGEQIWSVADLCARTELELLRFPNLGRKSIKEIKDKLAARGLNLAEREQEREPKPGVRVALPVGLPAEEAGHLSPAIELRRISTVNLPQLIAVLEARLRLVATPGIEHLPRIVASLDAIEQRLANLDRRPPLDWSRLVTAVEMLALFIKKHVEESAGEIPF